MTREHISAASYGSVPVQDKDDSLPTRGRGLLRALYATNAMLGLLAGMNVAAQAQPSTLLLAACLLAASLTAMALEVARPSAVVAWAPFYETGGGRAVCFLLLSAGALVGSTLLGCLSLLLTMLALGLHCAGLRVPAPLLDLDADDPTFAFRFTPDA